MIIPFLCLTGATLFDLFVLFMADASDSDGLLRKIIIFVQIIFLIYLILVWIDWIVSLAHGEYPLA